MIDEEHIFNEALARLDPAERADYLAQVCGENSQLKMRIESLLKAYAASDYLDAPLPGLETILIDRGEVRLEGMQVGPYHVLELLGEGGMGEVYLAQCQAAGQRKNVAFKVIKFGMDSNQVLARFSLEQEALRRLDHKHIAKLLDSGVTDRGRAYFVMELIQGRTLTQFCNINQLPIEARIELLIDTCRAVQHAHERGIVHRDIKPANVLVSLEAGTPVVKVIDFGVAKALEESIVEGGLHTRATQIVGTLSYMSPEQARCSSDVDPRTDVYSLGVLLYELLTGSTPSRREAIGPANANDNGHSLQLEEPLWPSQRIAELGNVETAQVCADRQTQPQRLLRQLRGDLDWISLKALERDRHSRYASPGALAADLQAFLEQRVITARPPKLLVHWTKWARRHRRKLQISIALLLLIATAGGLSLVFLAFRQSERQQRVLEATLSQSESERFMAKFVHDIREAHSFLLSGDNTSATQLLDSYDRQAAPSLADSFALPYLQSQVTKVLHRFEGQQFKMLDMNLSPNQPWIASSDRGGDVIIWDRNTRREIKRWNNGGTEITRVQFSPDGKLLATAGQRTPIQLWRVDDWTHVADLTDHEHTVNGLAWSPDGQQLASGDRSGRVCIWDVESQTCNLVLPQHADTIHCLAWSPDGAHLATADGTAGVHVWECATWKEAALFPTQGQGVLAMAFSTHGPYLAFGGYSSELSIVDLTTHAVLHRSKTDATISALSFGPHDELIAGVGLGYLQVFQHLRESQDWAAVRIASIESPIDMLRACAFDESQGLLYVATEREQLIKAVHAPSILGYQTTPTPALPVGLIPNLNLLLVADRDGNHAQLQNMHSQKVEFQLPFRVSPDCQPEYLESNGLMAIASDDADDLRVMVYRVDTWELQTSFPATRQVRELSFSHDGQRLAIAENGGGVRIWNLTTHDLHEIHENAAHTWTTAKFSPSQNNLIFAFGEVRVVECLPVDTYEKTASVTTNYQVREICFHPRGDFLVLGELDRITVWKSDLSELMWTSARPMTKVFSRIVAVELSPDQSTIAALNEHGLVRFWDVQTQSELFTTQLPIAGQGWIAFTDSHTLLVGSPQQASIFKLSGKPHEPFSP